MVLQVFAVFSLFSWKKKHYNQNMKFVIIYFRYGKKGARMKEKPVFKNTGETTTWSNTEDLTTSHFRPVQCSGKRVSLKPLEIFRSS